MTVKTPTEVLIEAADVLERDGWAQNRYHCIDGSHCALGAIGVASGYHYNVRPSPYEPEDATFDVSWDVLDLEDETARTPADTYIDAIRLLKGSTGGIPVGIWNDHPGRTKGEVVAALRTAAAVPA